MPSSDKGFVQAYNAQAGVDVTPPMLINESHISQAPNDKQDLVPALEALNNQPLAKMEALLTDAGCVSESNLAAPSRTRSHTCHQ